MMSLRWLGRVRGGGRDRSGRPAGGAWEPRTPLVLATTLTAGSPTGPTILGAPLKASGTRFIKKEL